MTIHDHINVAIDEQLVRLAPEQWCAEHRDWLRAYLRRAVTAHLAAILTEREYLQGGIQHESDTERLS